MIFNAHPIINNSVDIGLCVKVNIIATIVISVVISQKSNSYFLLASLFNHILTPLFIGFVSSRD